MGTLRWLSILFYENVHGEQHNKLSENSGKKILFPVILNMALQAAVAWVQY